MFWNRKENHPVLKAGELLGALTLAAPDQTQVVYSSGEIFTTRTAVTFFEETATWLAPQDEWLQNFVQTIYVPKDVKASLIVSSSEEMNLRREADLLMLDFKEQYQRGFETFLVFEEQCRISSLNEFERLYAGGDVGEWSAYIYKEGWQRLIKFQGNASNRIGTKQQLQKLRAIIQLCEYQLDLPLDITSDFEERLLVPVELLEERCLQEGLYRYDRPRDYLLIVATHGIPGFTPGANYKRRLMRSSVAGRKKVVRRNNAETKGHFKQIRGEVAC